MRNNVKLRQAVADEIDGYKYGIIGESWTRTDEGIVILYPSGNTAPCTDWLTQNNADDIIDLAIHFYKLGQQGGLEV